MLGLPESMVGDLDFDAAKKAQPRPRSLLSFKPQPVPALTLTFWPSYFTFSSIYSVVSISILASNTMDRDEIVTDSLLRSVLDSAERARSQCLEITNLLEQHKATPTTSSRDLQLELSKHQKQLFGHLAQVRSLNRDALYGVRKTKAETADARHEIDAMHLQLQNLYYEQRHLIGEIEACQSYE